MKRRMILCVTLALAVSLAVMMSAAAKPEGPKRGPGKGPKGDRAVLETYAADTWRSFETMSGGNLLPADNSCEVDGEWTNSEYTSPTNIGTYMWSAIAAERMGIISRKESDERLEETLAAVSELDRAHGFFFNWYDPETGEALDTWPVDGNEVRPFLSSVDNGWLAAALIMTANARPHLKGDANAILEGMDFGFFYTPYNPGNPYDEPGQLRGGYWTDTDEYTGHHYGLLNTEPRIASYIGIAMGDIPEEHYYRMFRTLPAEFGQDQAPGGEAREYGGVEVFEGHYVYNDKKIVPSWGGSMFEALMPDLLVPEAKWGKKSWAVNHPLYVEAHIEHGKADNPEGLWGFSPSNIPEGGYREYGVDEIGTNTDGYFSDNVVTPHASFLALPYARRAAMENLNALDEGFGAYGEHGFYDSVNVANGEVSDCVLALDQGMIMAALANELRGDVMQNLFTRGDVQREIRPLITPEEFTAGRTGDE